ncbi:class I SAM-dependent methyltransferase [Methylomarinum vadi]|uniref:class I SAM-dependent methyltransferase n=1 Tax=Methylomarinum vadi TaxID=438855 RepID=UPI00068E32FF|nr:class I SAM-dependent methyltransferase [Methylomarinum vadi]
MKSRIKFQALMALSLLAQSVFALDRQAEHHHGQANAHMNSMGFEQLVARFEAPGRDQWQKPEAVINSLGELNGKTIVEIGSGTGYFSFRLAEAGAHVIAADVDRRFLDYVDRRKTERKLGDEKLITRLIPYDSPQLGKAEADLVLLVDVYHHIENREDYFKQVLAGIKPGGKLVIVDFKLIETPDGPPLSMRIPPEQAQDELAAAGFTRFKLDTKMLPFQYILTAE